MRVAEIYGNIGRKGSGKTYLAMQQIKKERLVIFVDIAKEFEGTHTAYSPAELAGILSKRDKRKRCQIAFRYSERSSPHEAFEWAAAFATHKDLSERCVVVANETGMMIPKQKPLTRNAQKIITMGRHHNAPLIWTGIRITDVHPVLRDNTDLMNFFFTRELTSQEYVKKFCGHQGLKMFQALEKYDYLQLAQQGEPKIIKKSQTS